MRVRDCDNFHDFRGLARRRLPGPIFDYTDGAADEEATYRRNTASFERCDLVPNVLRGVASVDLSVTVMGSEAGGPLLLLADRAAAPLLPSGRIRRRGRGGDVRGDVRRLVARHGEPGGAAPSSIQGAARTRSGAG